MSILDRFRTAVAEPHTNVLQEAIGVLEEAGFQLSYGTHLDDQGQRLLYQRGEDCGVWIEWLPETGLEFAFGGILGHSVAELQTAVGALR